MAYTRPWPQVNFLLGTRDADEIDEASQETHLDLTERFTDILADVNADPWVIKKIAVLGPSIIRYPWSLGYALPDANSNIHYGTNLESIRPNLISGGGPPHMRIVMPVIVPIGYKLRWVALRLMQGSGEVASADLWKIFPGGLAGLMASAPPAVGTGWENRVIEGVGVEDAPASLMSYYCVVDLLSACSFQDMEVCSEPQ